MIGYFDYNVTNQWRLHIWLCNSSILSWIHQGKNSQHIPHLLFCEILKLVCLTRCKENKYIARWVSNDHCLGFRSPVFQRTMIHGEGCRIAIRFLFLYYYYYYYILYIGLLGVKLVLILLAMPIRVWSFMTYYKMLFIQPPTPTPCMHQVTYWTCM